MLKKLQAAPTVEVPWSGEVVASVRGLAPADITNLLVSVGEDLAGLFSLIEDLDKTKIDTKDATAAAKHPDLGDGYPAALTNFAYIASAVLDTDAVVSELRS